MKIVAPKYSTIREWLNYDPSMMTTEVGQHNNKIAILLSIM